MALITNNTDSAASSNNFEKAVAFVNVYIPRKDGTKMKLGALPLKASNVEQAGLVTWLKDNPTNLDILMDKLIMDFREVGTAPTSALDL